MTLGELLLLLEAPGLQLALKGLVGFACRPRRQGRE